LLLPGVIQASAIKGSAFEAAVFIWKVSDDRFV